MAIAIGELVKSLSVDQLRPLVSPHLLELISLVDPNLVETNSIRAILLGDDGGKSLLDAELGWKTIVNVLPNNDAKALCSLLEIGSDDPYDSLENFKWRAATDNQKQLVYSFLCIEDINSNFVISAQRLSLITADYPLFDHQRGPALAAYRALMVKPSKCILHIPTGGGKTRSAMVIICRWLINNPGCCVVWLASSAELLDQASIEFEKAWKHLGDRQVKLKRFWGNEKLKDYDFADTLIVAGLGKLSSAINRNPHELIGLLQPVSLVVFDEAHQAVAPTYKALIEVLRRDGDQVSLLGLTATPGRSWNDEIEDKKLAEFFNYQKVSIDFGDYASAVDYLVDKGYLAKVNYIDIKFESASKYVVSQSDIDDYSVAILKRIGEDQRRNGELVNAAMALLKKHRRILLFAPSVESAHSVANVLRALGQDSVAVDGDSDDMARSRYITRFRNNSVEPMILCNYGVLTTGFDAPGTSCVIIGRPTKSVVLYSQMVGRGIRGIKVGGNAEADIVTVVDTSLNGFGSISEGFNYWNDKWW